jgi:hypothetical protein
MRAMVASLLLAAAAPQDGAAERILKKHQSLRPSEEELAFYRLDWAADLAAALRRAKTEQRPVFFIATQQGQGAGNLFRGQC